MIGQLISNGYLVMDTCCFVHYCKRDTGKGFNYLDVRNYIETNGYAPAITPYTLYEFIQGCTSPKEIDKVRNQFLQAGPFWVINMQNLLGEGFDFKYGYDFFTEIGFHTNNAEGIAKKVEEWQDKAYYALESRVVSLAQIIAIIYIFITSDMDKEPEYVTDARCSFIDQFYTNDDVFTKHFQRFIHEPDCYTKYSTKDNKAQERDFKHGLILYIENMAMLMVWMSLVLMEQMGTNEEKILPYQDPEFVSGDIRNKYSRENMMKVYIKYKAANKWFSVSKLLNRLSLNNRGGVYQKYLMAMADKWFQKGYCGGGEQLANSIIDYVNLEVLEAIRTKPLIYITEDEAYPKFIKKSKAACFRETQEFCCDFYQG